MALNFCTTCYPLTLPDCPDSFDLETDLGAGTYYVWVKDRFAVGMFSRLRWALAVPLPWMRPLSRLECLPPIQATTSSQLVRRNRRIQETFTIDAADYDCWVIKFEEVNAA